METSKEKKANIVSVVQLAEADVPQAYEKPYSDWIIYGEDNLYPQELVLAWMQSATHNALTTGISQMIAGESIEADAAADPATLLKFQMFANKVNRDGDTLKDIIDRTAFDLYLHGYFGWEVIWNQARTEIAELYHVPAEGIRSGKASEETNRVNTYYFSPDWTQYRQKKFQPKPIPAFNLIDRSKARQLMFVKQYRPSQFYYSTPDYIGAMNWILLDNRVSEFNLNNIENGFFPSAVVQFFDGEPEQAEKDAIESRFTKKFTGKSSSKIVFVYNENPEQAIQFDTFEPADLSKRFKELMPEITSKIMVGHRVVSPMLFGVKDQTGWGNNADEIKNASILFNKKVVMPYQLIILRALAKILKVNAFPIDLKIVSLEPAQFLDGADADDASAEVEMAKQDKRKVLPKELHEQTLKHLADVGHTEKELVDDGWVLVQEDDQLTDAGRELGLVPIKENLPDEFAIQSDPKAPSALDQGMFKIRYKYIGPRDEKNRDFCADVLDMNLLYRKEDIDMMSFSTTNPEFGTYSIFNYKGSYGCRHNWGRRVFFRTGAVTGNQTIPETRKIPAVELPAPFAPNDDLAVKKNPKPQRT